MKSHFLENFNLSLFISVIILLNLFPIKIQAEQHIITVAKDGSGEFTSIQEAIESLPMFNYGRKIILIKSGTYNEKILIDRDYVTLRGEDRSNTKIEFSLLRSDWQANKDHIGPGVVNITGDDIIIENLTIENTQPEIGPHAFAVYGTGTRTILLDCNLWSNGADTVSLWNYKTGMYYHSNCSFKGAVDMVCPRGWCYIKDSEFYEVKSSAAIWHAGGEDKTQKLVIKNSTFDGVEGFELGRHHYDAQFFLIDCTFSERMKDKEIYRVTYPDEPQRDRPFNWGPRYFFYNCSKTDSNYHWFQDNLDNPYYISPFWTFDGQWDPETEIDPYIISYRIEENILYLSLSEKVTIVGNPQLKSNNGTVLIFFSGGENNTLRFDSNKKIQTKDIQNLIITNESEIFGTQSTVKKRNVDLNIKLVGK